MRTDHDQWDIVHSVGATALGVALGRAIETRRADRLVTDPYAQIFVDAVRAPGGDTTSASDDEDAAWASQATYQGVRSRFFDEFLTAAAGAGLRQVVLLAAGLDTRALRLAWPAGTTVYELDQPAVLDFKDRVLAEHDATATRVPVRADLRDDWPAALRAAGFDPATPSAWLAEGLLPYLPDAAESDLVTRVTALSAPGSRLAVEHFPASVTPSRGGPDGARLPAVFGVEVTELTYEGDGRTDRRLADAGWTVDATLAGDTARNYGRPLPGDVAERYEPVRFLTALRARAHFPYQRAPLT